MIYLCEQVFTDLSVDIAPAVVVWKKVGKAHILPSMYATQLSYMSDPNRHVSV